MTLSVRPVASKADKKAFIELAYRLNLSDPNWVPPLKDEVRGLITPGKNPWFEHAEAGFFLAERDGRRRSGGSRPRSTGWCSSIWAPGSANGGCSRRRTRRSPHALLAAAEAWLRGKGMTRSMGPFSLGIWDEPGLLVEGHDHPPMVMMGHNKAEYQAWVEGAGYRRRQGPLHLRHADLDGRSRRSSIGSSRRARRTSGSGSARSTRAASTRRQR